MTDLVSIPYGYRGGNSCHHFGLGVIPMPLYSGLWLVGNSQSAVFAIATLGNS